MGNVFGNEHLLVSVWLSRKPGLAIPTSSRSRGRASVYARQESLIPGLSSPLLFAARAVDDHSGLF